MNWFALISSEILTAALTAAITYLSTRRKYKSELKILELQITESIMKTYKLELAAMNERISCYVSQIHVLEKEIDKLNTENDSLKKEIAKLKNTKTYQQ